MVESRTKPRHRRLKEGRLIFNSRTSVVNCIVRDASDGGMRLKCGEPYLLPPEFDVVIRGEGTPRGARRVWVSGSEMGIAYLASPKN